MIVEKDLPRPIAVYSYIDKMQIWSGEEFSESQFRFVRRNCHGEPYLSDGPMPFNSYYRQGLQLSQPTPAALEFFASLKKPMVTYCEFARDFIFDDDADSCCDLFRTHLVQRGHRSSMEIRFFENREEAEKPNKHRPGPGFQTRTNKVGKRRVGRWLVGYVDVCRITGEVDCFHLETRFSGARALRRIGIHHPRDLINFDHDAHFAKYVTLYDIDPERLGRFHKNRRSGARRKKTSIIRYGNFTYNCESWSRLSKQNLRLDKWSLCRG